MNTNWLLFKLVSVLATAAFSVLAQETDTNRDLQAALHSRAEEGDAACQYLLAVAYRNGFSGEEKDYSQAVKWYRRAAEQNYAKAQWELGTCYYFGEGVARDLAEAVKWFRKAANQNLREAQYNLGVCYERGEGVTKNEIEAVKWYHKAAEQNLAWAQFHLAACFFEGKGVPKNYIESYKWLLLSAAQGDQDARKLATLVENKLTREQISDAQKLARDFRPRREGEAQHSNPQSSGTGFFVTEDGYLITNEHVAGNATHIRLVTAIGITPAEIVKVDAANDLALLKAPGKFAALPVAGSNRVGLGSTVVTVGFPNVELQGLAPKFARGEIGSLSGPQDDARYFQISVPVQPGNSGGPLVDEHGNVIGIVSAKLNAKAALFASGALPENVNYAVKSSFLLSFLESLPTVAAKLKEPNRKDMKFEEVVKQTKEASVLVLVY